MGVNDSLPLGPGGSGEFHKKKKFDIKNKVVQILWKFKFIDKRIFIGLGFFVAVILVFSLTLLVSNDYKIDSDDDSNIFDPFSKDSLGDAPLGGGFGVKSIEENKELISENIIELDEAVSFVSSSELLGGVRARLGSGEKLELEMGMINHEIIVDSVNGGSIEVTIRSDPVFATLRLGIPKKFDLDKDGFYDLGIELLEIVNNEGILIIQEIKESYDATSIDATGELIKTDKGFIYITVEDIPYSCERKEGYVDYSYIRISRSGESIFDEKRFNKIIMDSCPNDNSFVKYFCDGDNSLLSVPGNCSSRLETCFEGECIISSYERNIGKNGSPEENYLGENECHLVLGDTTYWVTSDEDTCKNLFIASNFLSKIIFVELLEDYGFDSSVIESKIIKPRNIKVMYSYSLENTDLFEDIESKFISDKCELLNYFGLDLYCFNSIVNKKNNNFEYVLNQITLLKDMNSSYSNALIPSSPYDYFKNNGITYVDGQDSSVYEGAFAEINSNCVSGDKTANYQDINGENSLFLCDGLFKSSTLYSNRISYSAMFFREVLSLLGNTNDECYNDTIIVPYLKQIECDRCYDYGSTDELSSWVGECKDIYKISDTEDMCKKEYFLPSECMTKCGPFDNGKPWDTYSRYIPSTREDIVSYNNFESLHGGYVDYLYGMSKNSDLSCNDRRSFYLMAVTEFDDFSCSDGSAPSYVTSNYPSC